MNSSITTQALFAEAILALELHRHEDVLKLTAQILNAAPAHIGASYLRAHALMELPEHSADSQWAWEQILALTDRPEVVAIAANNLGTLSRSQGNFQAAETWYKKALAVDPDHAMARTNLSALKLDVARRGMSAGAEESLQALEACDGASTLAVAREIIVRAPLHLGATYLLAHALMDVPGCDDESLAAWETVLKLGRDAVLLAVAANNIGTLHRSRRRFDLAHTFYCRALAAEPANAITYNNLGVLYKETQRLPEAEAAYRRAIELEPNSADAYGNLGALLCEDNRHLESILACETAIRLEPDSLVAHFNLGCALNKAGRSKQAIESYKQSLRINPEHLESLSNLLFALNFVAEAPPSETLEYANRFGRVTRGKALAYHGWNVEIAAARLRIGLVSGDMLDHPVGYFLEAFVASLDADRFALYGYMTCDRSSALTDRIRPFFTEWRMVQHSSDEELAKSVWDDGIHILIDLAGHTGFNRLAMFSCRPAPVQASWLGYFATTGVVDIDYFIADMTSVPLGQEWHFTESVWRLPETRLCFTPPHGAPAVRGTPAIRNGHVTFGCFQDLTKITDQVLDAWSTILRAHRSARLRLQTNRFSNHAQRSSFTQRLIAAQIDIARIDIHGAVARNAYLDAYGEVDLLLDTFPFSGGTTTAEALFMGVATVTIMGDRLISRQGAGFLLSVSLADWIAKDSTEYIEIALHKAGDIDALQALRRSLRERAMLSPLFDARRFADNFGAAMLGMWDCWLAEHRE